jgi:hypothetical protein
MSLLKTTCLGALASLGLLADEVTLVHAPEAGRTLTRTFEQTMRMELVDSSIEVEVNGEPAEAEAPDLEVTILQSERLVVVDEIEEADKAGVTKLKRTFETLEHVNEQEVSGEGIEGEPEPQEQTSELAGRVVRFTGEDGEWKASWADEEEGDEDLLAELEADGGFAFLLPEGAVEVGAEWKLDEEAFLLLGEPFGDLQFLAPEEDPDRSAEFDELFEEGLSVDGFVCELASVEEGIARITFEVEASTAVEQEDEVPEEAAAMGLEASTELEFTFELEGVLLWNLEERCMVSMELKGEVAMTIHNRQAASGDGFEFEADATQEFEGELSWSATVE